MATEKQQGFAHKKGAVAAARRVLGTEAIDGIDFEVFEIEGGRHDWKAIEHKRAARRTSDKPSPFAKKDNIPPTDTVQPPANPLDNLPIPGAPEAPAEPEQPEATPAPSAAATAFGAFAQQQLGNNGTERRAEDKGGSRRAGDKPAGEKKTREPAVIKNGVRQPSVGTVCREVWDELDKIRIAQEGTPPDSKQVKALAEQKKWNANNASIEFYQWRKFNGISGRSKQAPAAKPIKSDEEKQ